MSEHTTETRIPIDRARAMSALARTTVDLANLLRSASADVQIPHMTWTVAQCGAHLAIGDHMYSNQIVGPGIHLSIELTSAVNDWSVATGAGLDPATVAGHVEASTATFLDVVASTPRDATFEWWSGTQVTVEAGVAMLIGERLMHGWDIAQALGRPWHIDPDDAALAMAASILVMPLIVEPAAAAGFDAVLEIRLRGYDRYELRFTNGTLVTRRTDKVQRADCRISGDPVTMLLVGYGRMSQWGPMLRGRTFVWGRKPWVGLMLTRVLRNP